MFSRIAILSVPSFVGIFWSESGILSIAWSLAGSVLVACLAQTRWFRQADDLPIAHQLLRPGFLFHLVFVIFHMVGGTCYALSAAGYSPGVDLAVTGEFDFSTVAYAQQLMLLAQSSVAAGMKIAGFKYGSPKYVVVLPSHSLLFFSITCAGLGVLAGTMPAFWNFASKLTVLSAVSVLADIRLSLRLRRSTNLVLGLSLLSVSLLQMAVSGWKGPTMATVFLLGCMVYPLKPKLTATTGVAFALLWALYLYPFGAALRPLLWYEGVPQEQAIVYALDKVLDMPIKERTDGVWTMMVGRANELGQFQKYIEFIPDIQPYYGLELAEESLVALVPRLLWPDKPDLEIIAMQRVYAAGIVKESPDVMVSAKSNFYQDAYMSGGSVAIVLAGVFLGILLMTMSRFCERMFGGYDLGTCLIFAGFFGMVVAQTSNFVYFVGVTWTSFLLAWGLFLVGRMTGLIVPAKRSRHQTGGYEKPVRSSPMTISPLREGT